jgi:plasmid replication initiation protein
MMPNESEQNVVLDFKRKTEVYQPNRITESRQEFSEIEKKIMTCVVNQIGVINNELQGRDLTVLIPLTELTTSNNHAKVKKAAKSIQNKRIFFTSEPGQQAYSIVPFNEVSWRSTTGRDFLEVKISKETVLHFTNLGFEFTQYGLKTMLSMSSTYSQRMYEILMLFVSRKQVNFEYSIEQLKFILNCPEAYSFNELRKRSLLISQREIAEKAGVNFEFTPTKKDRKKVLAIGFKILTPIKQVEELIYQTLNQLGGSLNVHILRLMNEYAFPPKQRLEIATTPSLLGKFIQIDDDFITKKLKTENPTLFIQKELGFVVKRGPKPKTLT